MKAKDIIDGYNSASSLATGNNEYQYKQAAAKLYVYIACEKCIALRA